jgi:hypothetical protein
MHIPPALSRIGTLAPICPTIRSGSAWLFPDERWAKRKTPTMRVRAAQ